MVRIEAEVEIRASLERVWRSFTDLTCWKDWNSVLTGPAGAACLAAGEGFHCCIRPWAAPIWFRIEVEEVEPLRRVLWKGRKYGLTGHHEFLFEEIPEGVRVLSREALSGLPVAFGGLFFPLGRFRELTDRFLEDLKRGAESGD